LVPGWEWRSADFSEEDGVVHRLGLDRLFVALKPDEVRALLLRLADDLATDLTAARVEGFCAELLDDDSEDDPLLETEVQYEDRTVPLVFEYIKDSEAEAELMVLGPPPVVEQVQRQIESFCASASLRLIPAT
jgi:hypothetical protein